LNGKKQEETLKNHKKGKKKNTTKGLEKKQN